MPAPLNNTGEDMYMVYQSIAPAAPAPKKAAGVHMRMHPCALKRAALALVAGVRPIPLGCPGSA
eukprot:362471-Chlamydomonas_euryale.AAC.6